MTLLGKSRDEADELARQLLEAVRLSGDYLQRFPAQLSGGEKQRVAIARAFASTPNLLIADEAVSALDVSVQASILNLLRTLQAESDNTLIFISHDVAVVGYLADEIAVMYVGQLLESAATEVLFRPPYHPYTEALLSAIPTIDPDTKTTPIRLQGDVPSQINLPTGCPFHPRCPRYLGDICRDKTPTWQTTAAGKRIFCHIPSDDLEQQQSARGGAG
jgi:oligopeptide/dipeptide ABC transporter ATP-binding protein